ncbi:hypothetical protein EUB09_12735, partial [Mycobacterium tuberculosis]
HDPILSKNWSLRTCRGGSQTTATRRLSHRHTHLAAHTTPTLRHKGPFSHGVSRAFASGGR